MKPFIVIFKVIRNFFIRSPVLPTETVFSDKNSLNDLEGRSRSLAMARLSCTVSEISNVD